MTRDQALTLSSDREVMVMDTSTMDNIYKVVPLIILVVVVIYQGVAGYLDRLRHDRVVKQLSAALIAKNASEYHELTRDHKLDLKRTRIENELAIKAGEMEQSLVDKAQDKTGPHMAVG